MPDYTGKFLWEFRDAIQTGNKWSLSKGDLKNLEWIISNWLSRNGYSLEQFLRDDDVARECVLGVLNGD